MGFSLRPKNWNAWRHSALRSREGASTFMTDETKTTENLTNLAEEAKLTAEATQDPNRRRMLRMMALKYRRLAEFSRSQPDDRQSEVGDRS
jgi:hypothetical protein